MLCHFPCAARRERGEDVDLRLDLDGPAPLPRESTVTFDPDTGTPVYSKPVSPHL